MKSVKGKVSITPAVKFVSRLPAAGGQPRDAHVVRALGDGTLAPKLDHEAEKGGISTGSPCLAPFCSARGARTGAQPTSLLDPSLNFSIRLASDSVCSHRGVVDKILGVGSQKISDLCTFLLKFGIRIFS